jgi:hypothetical protein
MHLPTRCDHRWTEARLSSCQYGCKIYYCHICDRERMIHNIAYGCPCKTNRLLPKK